MPEGMTPDFHTDPMQPERPLSEALDGQAGGTQPAWPEILVEHYIPHVPAQVLPEWMSFRWPKRTPGDVLSVRLTILESQTVKDRKRIGA